MHSQLKQSIHTQAWIQKIVLDSRTDLTSIFHDIRLPNHCKTCRPVSRSIVIMDNSIVCKLGHTVMKTALFLSKQPEKLKKSLSFLPLHPALLLVDENNLVADYWHIFQLLKDLFWTRKWWPNTKCQIDCFLSKNHPVSPIVTMPKWTVDSECKITPDLKNMVN